MVNPISSITLTLTLTEMTNRSDFLYVLALIFVNSQSAIKVSYVHQMPYIFGYITYMKFIFHRFKMEMGMQLTTE